MRAVGRIIYVIVLMVYALLTGWIGQAVGHFGPWWFDILCTLAGVALFGAIGLFGLSGGRILAGVKDKNKKYYMPGDEVYDKEFSVVYVVLVGYILLMAVVSFVFSVYDIQL